MQELAILAADPAVWAALVTLIVMEVVLGIDNLIFISILSNKLPEEQRRKARRVGIGLALIMRLALLTMIAWIVGLVQPVIDLGLTGPLGAHGEPAFETQFSWRDLILIAGGLFLMWKATKEIHHSVDTHESDDLLDKKHVASMNFTSAIVQILLLDIVFSIDSILTAVGMTEHVQVMYVAVIVAVAVMLLAAEPLANFINNNPTVVMLALGFLLMIGMVLIAEASARTSPRAISTPPWPSRPASRASTSGRGGARRARRRRQPRPRPSTERRAGGGRMTVTGSGRLDPEARWTVALDEAAIHVTDPAGETAVLARADLSGVALETNDSGPWGADVWWLLFGADETVACAFPQGAGGEDALVAMLVALPGFDHDALIDAMASTGNALFALWRRRG
jgi:predicted tellurium resistance membrane protein TerC